MPIGCRQKRSNLCSFPLKRCISVYINKKSKTHRKVLKTLSSSSPSFFFYDIRPPLARIKSVRQSPYGGDQSTGHLPKGSLLQRANTSSYCTPISFYLLFFGEYAQFDSAYSTKVVSSGGQSYSYSVTKLHN